MARRLLKAALVGATPRGLERLLADVLEDVGFVLEIVERSEDAEIVFALVAREDVVATVCGLRQRGIRRIIALLSVHDDRVSRRAIDAGANICFALDSGVERLSFHVLALMAGSMPTGKPSDIFRLGPRAREVMQELRVFAAREREPTYQIRGDAEDRLEAATAADYAGRLPRPFRFGLKGRLQTTAMRLDSLAVERLERAIQTDLNGRVGRVA